VANLHSLLQNLLFTTVHLRILIWYFLIVLNLVFLFSEEIKIPFETSGHNFIYVKVKINGKGPFPFRINTGITDDFVIDKDLADKLEIKDYASSISIENFELKNVKVKTISLSYLKKGDEIIDGEIGNGFLKDFVVHLDYENNYIILYSPSSYKGEYENPVKLMNKNGLYCVEAKLNDKYTGIFFLDTALENMVKITSHFAKLHSLDKLPILFSSHTRSLLGDEMQTNYTLNKFQFDNIILHNLTLRITRQRISEECDGGIGWVIMRGFNWTFDLERNKAYITKNAKYNINENEFTYYQQGKMYMEGKKYKDAIDSFKSSLKFNCKYLPANYALLHAYFITEKYKEVISLAEEILKFYPNSVVAKVYKHQAEEKMK
jgi:tetratricopeptide (TPR) repeat protein